MTRILFYTNYYKQTHFFDTTIRRIANAGFPIVVLLTGESGPFRKCPVQHDNVTIIEGPHQGCSFDLGMQIFKKHRLLEVHAPTVLCHIDCDCFLSGLQELSNYINSFEKGKYDYACHTVGSLSSNKYLSDEPIGHVYDQMFNDNGPSEPPSPEPHYENAYQLVRKSIWDKLTVEEVGHHRRFLAALHKHGAKFGSHHASYRWDYTNWGKEWFHIGHIFEKFDTLEHGQPIDKYNPDSEFDLFRAGFFAAQERCYGSHTYPTEFHASLNAFYQHFGGKDRTLECWDRLVKGTCMENWAPLA